MTREKYESLPLKELREVAKARGLKGTTALRKPQLIDRMLEEDEKDAQRQSEAEEKTQPEAQRSGQNAAETASRRSGRRQSSGKETQSVQEAQPSVHAQDAAAGSAPKPSAETRADSEEPQRQENVPGAIKSQDSVRGILEVLQDGYGFIRSANFMPGDHDVYVSPSQIRKFNLKTGDYISGSTRMRATNEKFSALIHIDAVNDLPPDRARNRENFEDMVPIFPNERLRLEYPGVDTSMRIVDLVSPIGKGQRGMIVSQPKAGKTTLLKQIARSVLRNAPDMQMIILLIDERPEEVTDMKEAIRGDNVEVIYSTFDELPEHHKRVSEMVIERAKRLVEQRQDVIILLDSITRLARAYNLTVPPSGRTLSGGLDPAALHMPKRFFGAARNMRGGGSLTILATALVETGSKMDDVVYEEFKGTGNMELVLDRKLSERRVFPAIDIVKSGTRREDLLLSEAEQAAVLTMRRSLNGMKAEEASETLLNLFIRTRSNQEFCDVLRKRRV